MTTDMLQTSLSGEPVSVVPADCSAGSDGIWGIMGQCFSDAGQTVGFVIGLVAIVGWTYAHVQFYRFQRRRTKGTKRCNIRIFLAFYWFSDFLGCFGAVLAAQLPFQILFGLSSMLVHSACSLHSVMLRPLQAANKRVQALSSKKSSKMLRCLLPLTSLLLPTLTLMSFTSSTSNVFRRDMVQNLLPSEKYVPAIHIVGYVFGSVGAVLYMGAKSLDVFDAYTTVECSVTVIVMYMTSFWAEIFYVISVYAQRVSGEYLVQTLPWILPRLAAAGIDLGSLVQRLLQKRNGKRRKLSEESTGRLISSGSDLDWSDESEEVVWMPLKCVQAAAPSLPVCETTVQVLSESEGLSDVSRGTDCRRHSDGQATRTRRSRRKKTRENQATKSNEGPDNDVSGSSGNEDQQAPRNHSPLRSSDSITSPCPNTEVKDKTEEADTVLRDDPVRQGSSLHVHETEDQSVDTNRLTTMNSRDSMTNNFAKIGTVNDNTEEKNSSDKEVGADVEGVLDSDSCTFGPPCVDSQPEVQKIQEASPKETVPDPEGPSRQTGENQEKKRSGHIGKLNLKDKTIKQQKPKEDFFSKRATAAPKDRVKSAPGRRPRTPGLVRTSSVETPGSLGKVGPGPGKESGAKELQKKLEKVVKRSTSLKSLK